MNMKSLFQIVVPTCLALAIGVWAGRSFFTESPPNGGSLGSPATKKQDGPCPGGAQPAYWRAPMDPTFIRDAPGKSPMGMALIPECVGATDSANSGVVTVDSGTIQTIGVRTAPVEIRDLSRSVRAVGRIAFDERRVAHVHMKVQGWIEHLSVQFVGQEVKRGEPLLEIYSPELVATQEELLLAARYRDATGASPFEDVKSSGASLFDATRRRLELWDVSQSDIDRLLRTGEVKRTLTLYAPTSGVVTELAVRHGMEINSNSNLYTIADLSSLWVLADVYEFELPWIELGQKGTVELSYLPGESFTGPVTYISPFLDPKTRTAEVRLELPNPDGRLKPGMYGNTLIEAAPRLGAIAIPSEAVIRSGRRTLAIVALGEGRFAPREIRLGFETGDGLTEVIEGLSAGEEVVVSSQFLIDSESKFQEAIQKLLSAASDKASDEPAVMDGHAMNPSAHQEMSDARENH